MSSHCHLEKGDQEIFCGLMSPQCPQLPRDVPVPCADLLLVSARLTR